MRVCFLKHGGIIQTVFFVISPYLANCQVVATLYKKEPQIMSRVALQMTS